MNHRHYILVNRKVTPTTLRGWAEWMEADDDRRRVDLTVVGGFEVSTVFLGIDHNFLGSGSPILWETMVFDGEGARTDFDMDRCAGTIDQAEEMHLRMVERVKLALGIEQQAPISENDSTELPP